MKKDKISLLQQVLNKQQGGKKHTDADVKELEDLVKVPQTEKGLDMPKLQIFKEGYLQEIDLLFLPTSPFGYKYLLTAIDAHSKLVDGEPLRSKQPLAIVKAIEKIYDRHILTKPTKILSDSGNEFKGEFATWCETNNIILRYSEVNRHRQTSLVESANKRIGGLLLKLLALDEQKSNGKLKRNWKQYLRDVIDVLNKNKGNPIDHETSESPIITKQNNNILPVGQQVRVALDYASDATGKRLIGFRSGDVRWSGIKKITDIILKPSYPPLYEVNNDANVLYTFQQLQPLNTTFV